jgi:hypothetical protein
VLRVLGFRVEGLGRHVSTADGQDVAGGVAVVPCGEIQGVGFRV